MKVCDWIQIALNQEKSQGLRPEAVALLAELPSCRTVPSKI